MCVQLAAPNVRHPANVCVLLVCMSTRAHMLMAAHLRLVAMFSSAEPSAKLLRGADLYDDPDAERLTKALVIGQNGLYTLVSVR